MSYQPEAATGPAPREAHVTVREMLYVIATQAEAVAIGGALVHVATSAGMLTEPPVLAIDPDFTDRCDLLGAWAADHVGEGEEVELPTGVGIWRISMSFLVRGTEAEIERVAHPQLATMIDRSIRLACGAGMVERRSPDEGVYWFSLVNVPDEDPAEEPPEGETADGGAHLD